jgi:hypothetical protein
MKKIILLLALALSFSGCEKDDICDANTPTTPRLVITFYDITIPSLLKNVKNLKVVGAGMPNGIIFNPSAPEESKYWANGNTISIPLKANENTTSYSLTLNSGDPNPALVNEDNIKFDYTRQDFFVSRACGFKTLFKLDPTPFTHTDAAVADQKWIKYISVEKSNIENENETHIKIFF